MKIVILVENFAPVQAISSIRWSELAWELSNNHDCNIVVITPSANFSRPRLSKRNVKCDITIEKHSETVSVRYLSCGPLETLFNIMSNVIAHVAVSSVNNSVSKDYQNDKEQKRFLASGLKTAIKIIVKKALKVVSILKELELAKKTNKEFNALDQECDVLISSFGPYWPSLASEKIKRNHPQTVWIADYRDPVASELNGVTEYNLQFAKNHTNAADCILSVSEKMIPELLLPSCQRVEVISNGFVPRLWNPNNVAETDSFILFYSGQFYGGKALVRDISPIAQAIVELSDEGDVDLNDISLVCAGPDAPTFHRQMAPYREKVLYEHLGLLSRSDCLDLQSRASMLVLLDWCTEGNNGSIPGKIYEYFSCRKPIVGVVIGNYPISAVSEMVANSGCGVLFQESKPESFEALKQCIAEQYKRWKATGRTYCNVNEAYISNFEYCTIANQLYELIVDIASTSRTNANDIYQEGEGQ